MWCIPEEVWFFVNGMKYQRLTFTEAADWAHEQINSDKHLIVKLELETSGIWTALWIDETEKPARINSTTINQVK